MKTKIIIIAVVVFVILWSAGMIWIGYKINKPPIDTEAILEDNISVQPADNQDELIDSLTTQVVRLNAELLEKHNEENYQPVNITINEPIPTVNEYIDFVPDYLPELPEIKETRIAITNYHYKDMPNAYSLDLKIKYVYSTMTFEIEPSELKFKRVKNRPFCFSAVLLSNGGGVHLSYDLFKRLRLGSGIYVDKEISPFVGISVGWVF